MFAGDRAKGELDFIFVHTFSSRVYLFTLLRASNTGLLFWGVFMLTGYKGFGRRSPSPLPPLGILIPICIGILSRHFKCLRGLCQLVFLSSQGHLILICFEILYCNSQDLRGLCHVIFPSSCGHLILICFEIIYCNSLDLRSYST